MGTPVAAAHDESRPPTAHHEARKTATPSPPPTSTAGARPPSLTPAPVANRAPPASLGAGSAHDVATIGRMQAPSRNAIVAVGVAVALIIAVVWFSSLDERVERALDNGDMAAAARLVREGGGPRTLGSGAQRLFAQRTEAWINDALVQSLRTSQPPKADWPTVAAVATQLQDLTPLDGDRRAKLKYVEGQVAFEAKRWDDARFAFSQAQHSNEPLVRALALNGSGKSCWRDRDSDCAIQFYRAAAQLAPSWVIPLVNLGGVFLNRNANAEAENAYASAIKLDPNRAYAHYGRGVALFREKRYSEARADLELSLRLSGMEAEPARDARQILTLISHNGF